MGRLYPPMIEGTIPAFYGTTLVVPFSLNKAISSTEIADMRLKIKTVSGILRETITAKTVKINNSDACEATFTVNPSLYTIGQSYKIQVAFVSKQGNREEVGYYSTVGVVKYTTLPTVSIEGLTHGKINPHNYYYTGLYSQQEDTEHKIGGDSTEKMYSYRFVITDGVGNIIDDTGELLHNSTTDLEPYQSTEQYCFAQDIKSDESYYIRFIVTTTNGMVAKSPKYRLTQSRSIKPEIEMELVATLDQQNGFIDLSIANCSKELITGTFLISRNSQDNSESWVEFKRFSLHAVTPDKVSFKDCTIAHGMTYKYSIQQYNANGVYSERLLSNPVTADFEDAFLFDGTKQLRIRYNPKVSSFKTNHADQKTDTIGSQHPFITRNGNMAYKEFPISGLISYRMDIENNLFMPITDLGIAGESSNLTYDNIMAERIFKMNVLDWLNNGKPKLFRSPTEGNFVVRLVNVSLTPNDTLGRMLHTFNATAYEIANFTSQNLEKFKIIDAQEQLEEQTQWSSVYLPDLYAEYNEGLTPEEVNEQKRDVRLNTVQRAADSVLFTDMRPGSLIYLDDEVIMIGATGSYRAESETGFKYIGTDSRFLEQGMCTYGYRAKTITMFGLVNKLTLYDIPVQQIIGTRTGLGLQHVYESLQDIRTSVTSIATVRFFKRPVQYLYINVEPSKTADLVSYWKTHQRDMHFYNDMNCSEEFNFSDRDELAIYQLRLKRSNYDYAYLQGEQYYVDKHTTYFSPYLNYYLDGSDTSIEILPMTPDLFSVFIDGSEVSLNEIEKYVLEEPEEFKEIYPRNGIITEVGYSKQIIDYSFEDEWPAVKALKDTYLDALAAHWDFINGVRKGSSDRKYATTQEIKSHLSVVHNAYYAYLSELRVALERYKESYGIDSNEEVL